MPVDFVSVASGGRPSSAWALLHAVTALRVTAVLALMRFWPCRGGEQCQDQSFVERGTDVVVMWPARRCVFEAGVVLRSACKGLRQGDLDDFECAVDALALDDDINGGMNQFANIGAGQIAAAIALFHQ